MADKKRKKPRHTHLILPGDGQKAAPAKGDRLGRTVPHAAMQGDDAPPEAPQAPAAGAMENPTPDEHRHEPKGAPAPEAPPPEGAHPGTKPATAPRATRLPKAKKRLSPVRRKRRRRRIQFLVFVLLVAVAVLVYSTGAYLTVFSLAGDAIDNVRIALMPSDGFPAAYPITGLIKAESMGKNGFAVLGERDLYVFSSSGLELQHDQHTYPTPGLSAGKNRLVLYQRGGTEFTVEGRSDTIARRTTEQDIQFAAISAEGWLAVATASRYRASLHVYGLDYDVGDPLLSLSLVDEKPVLAAFAPDNRNLLLGCYSVGDGALVSTLHLLRTDRDTIQATVAVHDAQLLLAQFWGNSRILAVFDTHTALYDTAGKELARYDYGTRSLLTCNVIDGRAALVFGAATQERVHAVLLDAELQPVLDAGVETGAESPRVLAAEDGLYLLSGQTVYAYAPGGALAGTLALDARAYELVHGGQPLVLTAEGIQPVGQLLAPESAAQTSAAHPSGGASAASAASASAQASGAAASHAP